MKNKKDMLFDWVAYSAVGAVMCLMIFCFLYQPA
jgi:hypothetical protein